MNCEEVKEKIKHKNCLNHSTSQSSFKEKTESDSFYFCLDRERKPILSLSVDFVKNKAFDFEREKL